MNEDKFNFMLAVVRIFETERATAPATDHAQGQGETPRMSWAQLLKRVFDIDIEHCSNCGGALKIIAVPSTRSGQASKIRR